MNRKNLVNISQTKDLFDRIEDAGVYPDILQKTVQTHDHIKTLPFPQSGFLRLKQILGDPKAKPPTPAIIPVSNSAWWDGIKKGIYPRPVKLSARTSAWRIADILALIEKINEGDIK